MRSTVPIALALTAAAAAQGIPEKEAALGRALSADVRQRTTAIESPIVQHYLDGLSQRLSTVRYVLSPVFDHLCPPTHEPAALPGGYIFVPAALFMAVHDESEFAGMLMHSMAHIALRHGMRQQSGNGAAVPLIFMGGGAGFCSDAQTTIPRGFVETARKAELDADAAAVEGIARAGFDPDALGRYLRRIGTEPSVNERLAALPHGVPMHPQDSQPGQFEAARAEVRRLSEARRGRQ